jgi:hypothetical protein
MKELEVRRKTIRTFESWRGIPACYATRSQWLKRGRKVKPDEKRAARWISTAEAAPGDCGEVWLDDPDLYLLVDKEVPLFHIDQTKPVNFAPRTIAYLGYEEIFYEPARKDRHILREENWQTITAKPGAAFFWASGQLSRQTIRQHINGTKIIGVMATVKTHFVAIDHDFHGNDRQVFMEQAAVLLDHFHGWGTLHHQVRVGEITGMHYLLTFNEPKDLKKVTALVRKRLAQLDEEHPDLAERAKAAGMPTFSKMEIFPQPTKGFRLPLCQGYQMLLDRSLPLVMARGKAVQDVVAYVNWLNDPGRKHMPKAEILDLLGRNLGRSKPAATAITQPTTRQTTPANHQPQVADIGPLKGCCRQKVTGFWSGVFNPKGSLNAFIVVTARIFFFEGVGEEAAVRLLGEYVRAIPDDARDCSSRLMAEDWPAIDTTIRNDVAKAYADNGGQKMADVSSTKLRAAVACWQKIGFRLSDKTTWGRNGKAVLHIIQWSAKDRETINHLLGPALGKKHAQLACDVAAGIVKLVAHQHACESGMGYTYWATFLREQYGIRCGNRNKVARIIKACVALGLIKVHCKAIWGERRGMATIYSPGGLARSCNNKRR